MFIVSWTDADVSRILSTHSWMRWCLAVSFSGLPDPKKSLVSENLCLPCILCTPAKLPSVLVHMPCDVSNFWPLLTTWLIALGSSTVDVSDILTIRECQSAAVSGSPKRKFLKRHKKSRVVQSKTCNQISGTSTLHHDPFVDVVPLKHLSTSSLYPGAQHGMANAHPSFSF